jgi:predicted AlkP superfamily pyrophosphatase or phosphodiesterase
MRNLTSLSALTQQAKFSLRFVKPCYDSYCFANIPSAIDFLLTGSGQLSLPADVFGDLPTSYDKVFFLFIDGFGWRFFEKFAEKFFLLDLIQKEGVVSKLTAQFPSTTAAHVTCMHTGQEVGQSGVYEWHYYEPLVDTIISPLLFCYGGEKTNRDTLKNSGVASSAFFPQQTLYNTLAQHGVTSHIFQYQAYTASTYSEIVFRGAQVHPYRMLQEAFDQMVDLYKAPVNAPLYSFFYFDRIDAHCHLYGPDAEESAMTMRNFWETLDRQFFQRLKGAPQGKTLLMISADHGQTAVDPDVTFYLNHQIPYIERYFKTNARGQPIVPAGSPRDMFLHVKEAAVDELMEKLRRRLDGQAEVYRTQSLIEQGFFGRLPPSQTFLDRVGNIVVLPYEGETVWWHDEGRYGMHFYGHHGGLTADEMEIPLLLQVV